MSGALVVFDRAGTGRYLFDIQTNYYSDDDQHVEYTLFYKLSQSFPNYSLPNGANVIIFVFASPCQRCVETIRNVVIAGSPKLSSPFQTSWMKNTVATKFKFVYAQPYIGTSGYKWPDQMTMDGAYAKLVGEAPPGRLSIVPYSNTQQKNGQVATTRGGTQVW